MERAETGPPLEIPRPAASGRTRPGFLGVFDLATAGLEARFLAALLAFAFLLRLAFVLAYGLSAPPVPWGDDVDYHAIARGIAFDHVYRNAWFPPGYPAFLALIYGIAGPSLAAVRLVQAALGAVTCGVVYALGKAAFGEAEREERREAQQVQGHAEPRGRLAVPGAIAAVLLACYPGHVYMSWRLMAETLFTLLVALAALAALRLARQPTLGRAAALGALLGASVLVKSNLFLLPPLLILWAAGVLLLRRPRQIAVISGVSGVARVAALAASFALVTLAGPLANALTSPGGFRPLPGNAGHTLWWSNNPVADGYFVDPAHFPAGRAFIAAHPDLARGLRAADGFARDRANRGLALAWMRERPGDFLALVPRKLANAFGPFPRAAVFEGNPPARRLHLLTFGVLLPFAVGGLVLSLPGRRRSRVLPASPGATLAPLYLVLLSYALMVVVFYGTPRFTLAVVPELLVFAGLALAWLLAAVAARIESRRTGRNQRNQEERQDRVPSPWEGEGWDRGKDRMGAGPDRASPPQGGGTQSPAPRADRPSRSVATAEPRRRPWSRRLAWGTLRVALVAFTCLLLGEIGLRFFGYGSYVLYRPDPELLWVPIPHQAGRTEVGRRPITINGAGLRYPTDLPPRDPREIRVFTFGDSVTMGWGMADGETYSADLEPLLASEPRAAGALAHSAQPPRRYRVVSAGVNAYPTALCVRRFRRLLAEGQQIDVAILAYSFNHAHEGLARLRGDDREAFLRKVFWKGVLRRSALYNYLIEDLLRQAVYYRIRDRLVAGSWDMEPSREKSEIPEYVANLERMRALAAAHNVRLILLLLGSQDQRDDRRELDDFQRAFLDFARRRGIPACDMIRRLAPLDQRDLFIDHTHPSAAGHRLIARELAREIARGETPGSARAPQPAARGEV